MEQQQIEFCSSNPVAYSSKFCEHVRIVECLKHHTIIRSVCNNA
jgi:hypothetical protein